MFRAEERSELLGVGLRAPGSRIVERQVTAARELTHRRPRDAQEFGDLSRGRHASTREGGFRLNRSTRGAITHPA
jgi:hypothetical protein